METRIDFLRWLQTDMALNILMFLDDPADLVRASAVSCFWRHFVIANGLCKQLCVRMFPQLSSVAHVIETSCCCKAKKSVGVESSNLMEWEALERDHIAYAPLFRALTGFALSDCIAGAVGASSTDNYPFESIANTLEPGDRVQRRASYWSSKGHRDPAAPETLLYKLSADLCVITQINIRPFQAYFQLGHPIYSAKAVRFRFGHAKSLEDIEGDLMHLPLLQPADDKFIWTYTSIEFPMAQENSLQIIKLPEPVLCIGGFLQIELLGRVQRQDMDGLFYICVSHVQVVGRSLPPTIGIEILEPSGKFSLKYDSGAFDHTLTSSSYGGPPVSSVVPPLPPEEMLWGRLGNLVQFLIQGNEPDVEPLEWDDVDDDEDNEVDEGVIL
ncbi:unnamed protein product [Ilex paraguariensis]|uniref:F-box protein n=1 Tax=Ilex paraguariensis TaxID=185542 RepID=A0ABC8RS00_9AQUA